MYGILTGKTKVEPSIELPEIVEEKKAVVAPIDPPPPTTEEAPVLVAEESKEVHPHDLLDKGSYLFKLQPEDEADIDVQPYFEKFSDANDL